MRQVTLPILKKNVNTTKGACLVFFKKLSTALEKQSVGVVMFNREVRHIAERQISQGRFSGTTRVAR